MVISPQNVGESFERKVWEISGHFFVDRELLAFPVSICLFLDPLTLTLLWNSAQNIPNCFPRNDIYWCNCTSLLSEVGCKKGHQFCPFKVNRPSRHISAVLLGASEPDIRGRRFFLSDKFVGHDPFCLGCFINCYPVVLDRLLVLVISLTYFSRCERSAGWLEQTVHHVLRHGIA